LAAYMGKDLTTWAAEGHYNIELQPVITVNMDYLKPAASASLVVAQKAPDKWVDFHHALLAYFRSQFQASNGTVVQNLDASWKQVKTIAAEVGVPSDVIDTFPVNAVEDYLKASTTAWQNAGYSGRGNGLGTPELVKDHSTVIPLGTQLGELRQSIANEFGITDSASQGITDTPAPEATEPSQSGADDAQSSETTDSSN
ncbi:MAG: thioredoxin, partial [Actinomyces sp.]|nr:thioredoxin [Actinomyces sp.]